MIEHTSWDLRGGEDLEERVRQYYAALGLQRVQATIRETSTRSERVLRNGGFAYEGLLRAGDPQSAGALIGLDVPHRQCYE